MRTTLVQTAHSDEHEAAAAAATQPVKPRARLELVDWALLSLSIILLLALGSYLLHAAHHESHRLHHTPVFSKHAAASVLGRRQRSVPSVVNVAATAAASASDALVPSSSRHLLAAAPATDPATADRTNSFLPFTSAEHRDALYKEWAEEFKVYSDKFADARKAFQHILGPAVDKHDIHAAPLGSTNYCVAGFEGRQSEEFIFTLRHTFHMLGMDPKVQKAMLRRGGVTWSLVLWVTPQVEKCQ